MDVSVKFNILSGLGLFALAALSLYNHLPIVRFFAGGYILVLLVHYNNLLKRYVED